MEVNLHLSSSMADPSRVVLIDDEVDFCEDWESFLSSEGYWCSAYSNSVEAVAALRSWPADLVLVDLKMPGLDGLAVLREVKKSSPGTAVVLMTAYATVETAIQALGEGAFDYLPKPFTSGQLMQMVLRGFEHRSRVTAPVETGASGDFSHIIGASAAIQQVVALAKRACQVDCNVVLLGESGAGKEVIARDIHANSVRSAGPFLPVDCAALPETLLESELFGHEKGSFTGAHTARPGLIETAAGGTVFLDEVTELSLNIQAKLLRVLEDHQVRHLGGRSLIRVDVRFMCATNQNLQRLVQQRKFREDLYYRLNVLLIEVPPVRDRKSDIPLLAEHFLKRCVDEAHRSGECATCIRGISSAAMMVLQNYDWPGNVRELRNVIERACALSRSEYILPQDLPAELLQKRDSSSPLHFQAQKHQVIEWFEAGKLRQLLNETCGNVTEAARLACMGRTAFQRLMRKYGLHAADFQK